LTAYLRRRTVRAAAPGGGGGRGGGDGDPAGDAAGGGGRDVGAMAREVEALPAGVGWWSRGSSW